MMAIRAENRLLTAAGIVICAFLVSLVVGVIGVGFVAYASEGATYNQFLEDLMMGGFYMAMTCFLIPSAFLLAVALFFAQLRPVPTRAIKLVAFGFLVVLTLLFVVLAGWATYGADRDDPFLLMLLIMLAGVFGPSVVIVLVQAWLVGLTLERNPMSVMPNTRSIWMLGVLAAALLAALIIALKTSSELLADDTTLPLWMPGALAVSALVAAIWLSYLRFGRSRLIGSAE